MTELFFKSLPDEIDSAIAEEKEAIDDYAELMDKLRKMPSINIFIKEADIVKEIRNDELDHLKKFEAMKVRLKELI